MVVAYRLGWIEAPFRHLVKVSSIVLPNLILAKNAVPEYLQENCQPDLLTAGMVQLIDETPARAAQCTAFDALDAKMRIDGHQPADLAAKIVLQFASAPRSPD